MDDLWPDDIGDNLPKAPVTILRDQASALGQKTKNIVEAEVSILNREFSSNNDIFSYAFIIVAPALNVYRYNLFSISHNIQLYPVTFDLDTDIFNEVDFIEKITNREETSEDTFVIPETTVSAATEEDFLRILKIILNSKKARYVINALLSQSVGIERKASW